MSTITLSGNVMDTSEHSVGGVYMILVNCADRTLQYNYQTTDSGNFSMQIMPGIYDLLYNNDSHMPGILAGLSLQENFQLVVLLNEKDAGGINITGEVVNTDDNPASGYSVQLLNAMDSTQVAETNCDEMGDFIFSDCKPGTYLLRISGDGKSYNVMMPLPPSSVHIQIELQEAQTQHPAIPEFSQFTPGGMSIPFLVCKQSNGPLNFTSGLMAAASNEYMRTAGYPVPVVLNIYTAKSSNIFFSYAVNVDCTHNPFFAMPPSSNYTFSDQSGDGYYLSAWWPMLHTVSYNSSQPDIVKVFMSAGPNDENYWPTAPVCSN